MHNICFDGSGPDVCHENLVTGPRGVPDNQITASSTYSNSSGDNYAPYRGRLYSFSQSFQNGTYLNGGWSARSNDKNQYIQVCWRVNAAALQVFDILKNPPFPSIT